MVESNDITEQHPPPSNQQPVTTQHNPLASVAINQQSSPQSTTIKQHPPSPPSTITQQDSSQPPATTPITQQHHPSPSPRPPRPPQTITQEHPNHNLDATITINTDNNTSSTPITTNANHNQATSSTTTSTIQHQPPPPPSNKPCLDLLKDESRAEFIATCVPLYEASIKGDLKSVHDIIHNCPNLVGYGITENQETALHVAVSAESNNESTELVAYLVSMMNPNELQLQNRNGNTALCLAAGAGNVKMAMMMVDKNDSLLAIPNKKGMLPLYTATLFGKHDMTDYLYDKSNHLNGPGWTPENRRWIFEKCILVGRFDIALKIFENHEKLLTEDQDLIQRILGILAQTPLVFNEPEPHIWSIMKSITCSKVGPAAKESEAMQLLRKIWTEIVKKPTNEIDKILRGPPGPSRSANGGPTHPSRILFVAAEKGNIKFIVELIHKYHDLIWKVNDLGQTIFHIAVSHRHENIYNLLYEIGLMKDLITPIKDSEDNNMLHLVGTHVETSQLHIVSGVAFQMQRELFWFKEVESMIPIHHRERKNKDGLKPYELFTKNHKDLVSHGEMWMKETSNRCMVVAALIATIVFTVAFTIPGGYKQEEGWPVFLHNGPFLVFVVLDAISLILSTTSILVFLSILTSRFAQMDFLESLPKKLMVGLVTLFLSIMTMMIAFSVSFFVLYRSKFIAVAIIISVLAVIPIISYAKLQYPLLMDVFLSTRHSTSLFRPKKRMLYYKDPRV